MSGRKPLIVGLGGTIRAGSSTERALAVALRAAEAKGAETRLFGGEFLSKLPIFDPRPGSTTPEQTALAEAVRAADGILVASPGYHGSISGVIKNALDTLELTREDEKPYFQGRPVGTIITADGWQAAGTTLMALRAIIHALRGWPTPFGAALNAGTSLFDEAGECREPKDAWQLATVAEQVMEFANMRARP
ncbi:NADPH-dependent FMN reductase [Phenylobacterium soli]|uniref:FMN reductase n=1 Tax=Phenylobacterium soli TaxID=2170551 RepID=A0A328AI70_9CAUL|nr:NADPH-dependent FMN reductase [Phenylobacterium soli]RAK53756.1 FMN reductase [Phenylobacterium soli]